MEEYSGETVERYDSTNYLTLEINVIIITSSEMLVIALS